MRASRTALILLACATPLCAPPLQAQTATPRPGGGLNVSCPSGRTASVIPRGTEVLITVREKDGREWGTADMPSSGAPDPQNKVGNPARVAEAICRM